MDAPRTSMSNEQDKSIRNSKELSCAYSKPTICEEGNKCVLGHYEFYTYSLRFER